MKYSMNYIFPVLLLLLSCNTTNKSNESTENVGNPKFDLQGHRGARGLMPENTIEGFLKALEFGVTTLELDLAVTSDSQLVVSHEPWINQLICFDSTGAEIEEEYLFNIYKMTYKQVNQFDCGTKENPRFPVQSKIRANKPRLIDVVNEVNYYLEVNNMDPVRYNIEIKTEKRRDNIFHPSPQKFSDLVYDFISSHIDKNLVTVQSFDFRVLKYFNEKYPEIQLALLIENELDIQQNLDSLGFEPDIYSCWYKLLNKEKISALQQKNIQVIPWTVNDSTDMKQLIKWGVDGIITDYPNIAQNILTAK